MKQSEKISRTSLFVILLVSLIVPSLLALKYVPIGEGPDELSHIDHAFYKFTRGLETIDVEAGLYEPGKAPLGQGHQPPLYYWLGAGIYSLFLDRNDVSAFTDYQLGLAVRKDGFAFGGASRCTFVQDDTRAEEAEVKQFRKAVHGYRVFSALLFALTVFLAYLAAKHYFKDDNLSPILVALFCAATPTAIWRSVFVNNDNLVAFLGSLVFCFAFIKLVNEEKPKLKSLLFFSFLSALAFLSKYNGVVALGFVGLLVLLCSKYNFVERIKSGILVVLAFVLFIAFDLIENYQVDGHLFSTTVIIRIANFLYRPSSILTILSDPLFFKEAFKRYWLSFHGQPVPDPNFPHQVFNLWFGIAIASSIGVLFALLKDWRRLVFILVSIFGSYFVLLYLAANFPLPHGRYLHTAIIPVSLFVVIGLKSVFKLVLRSEKLLGIVLTLLFSSYFIFVYQFSTSYISSLYLGCINSTEKQIVMGGDATSVDLDADGVDEIMLFHRVRNRSFFAKREGDDFQIVPEFTRITAFMPFEIHAADINGNGKENPTFWNAETAVLSSLDARDVLGHNKKTSEFIDLSGKFTMFHKPEFQGSDFLVNDLNSDFVDDFVFERDGKYIAELNKKTRGRYASSERAESGDFTVANADTCLKQIKADPHSKFFYLKNGEELELAKFDYRTGKVAISPIDNATCQLGAERVFVPGWQGD